MRRFLFICAASLIITTGCIGNVHYDEAIYFFEGREYSKAINELKLALREEPLNIEIYHTLAECYLRTKRTNEAAKIYNTILTISLNDKKAKKKLKKIIADRSKKAQEFIEKDDFNSAYSAFKKVLEMDIENDAARKAMHGMANKFVELGDGYYENGDNIKAAEVYRRALELDPDVGKKFQEKLLKIKKIYTAKAEKLKKTDSYAAIDAYEFALAVDPLNSDLHFNSGKIYGFFAEFKDDGFSSFKNAIAIDPRVSKYHAYLGELYYLKANRDLAKKEYLFALELVQKEIREKKYDRKRYKYFYDAINPYNRVIKELENEKGLWFLSGKGEKVRVDLSEEDIRAYKKASNIHNQFPKLYKQLKKVRLKESEKSNIVNNIYLLHDMLEKNKEDLSKEKEMFDLIVKEFEKAGSDASEEVNKLGKLIGAL